MHLSCWVQTDMGGSNATLTVRESAEKIADFALNKNFKWKIS